MTATIVLRGGSVVDRRRAGPGRRRDRGRHDHPRRPRSRRARATTSPTPPTAWCCPASSTRTRTPTGCSPIPAVQRTLLRQGVTTVIVGQDGVSYAPGSGTYASRLLRRDQRAAPGLPRRGSRGLPRRGRRGVGVQRRLPGARGHAAPRGVRARPRRRRPPRSANAWRRWSRRAWPTVRSGCRRGSTTCPASSSRRVRSPRCAGRSPARAGCTSATCGAATRRTPRRASPRSSRSPGSPQRPPGPRCRCTCRTSTPTPTSCSPSSRGWSGRASTPRSTPTRTPAAARC